jgi:hypothetical protein
MSRLPLGPHHLRPQPPSPRHLPAPSLPTPPPPQLHSSLPPHFAAPPVTSLPTPPPPRLHYRGACNRPERPGNLATPPLGMNTPVTAASRNPRHALFLPRLLQLRPCMLRPPSTPACCLHILRSPNSLIVPSTLARLRSQPPSCQPYAPCPTVTTSWSSSTSNILFLRPRASQHTVLSPSASQHTVW